MPDASVPARVVGRFQARAEDIGLTPPPRPLRLKLLTGPKFSTLFVQASTGGDAESAVAWLEPTRPLRIEFGSRNILRADYDPLPEGLRDAFAGVEMDLVRLDTLGGAAISVTGTRLSVAAFARRLHGPHAPLALVLLRASAVPKRLLTDAQDEAVRAAVAAGYYRIPRALNLDDLARRLGVGSASLSERLRRAEGRIITRYVEAGGATPWDEKTLFDVHALPADRRAPRPPRKGDP